MKDELRHDIVQRWQQGQSQRQIASELGVSRRTVERVLAAVSQQRAQGNVPPELQPAPPRTCAIDAYEATLRELLQRHPQLTAQRCWQELRAQGFTGSYKQVWSRVRALRPRSSKTAVMCFETDPGQRRRQRHKADGDANGKVSCCDRGQAGLRVGGHRARLWGRVPPQAPSAPSHLKVLRAIETCRTSALGARQEPRRDGGTALYSKSFLG